ncbi:NADAR family protein [Streptomyces sp. NPDC039016]|uniref:NADAR family protein n=1 Tax=Streptomyces sp. NPDC039016 TaxID=3154330 RepID=UPI00340DCC3B
MDWRGPTYRTVDAERIDGAWCHVWWRNHHDDQYFLDDLVVFGGRTYPSVLHAYWALSAADPADHDRIRDAEEGRAAQELGGRVARRADWHRMRVAVMGALLEAKFTQHPELAQVLLATGDSVIGYTGFTDSPFWRDVPDQRGRNWMGRLLELTRAKLAAGPLLPD